MEVDSKELKEIFNYFDQKHNNRIDREEFLELMDALGMNDLSEEELRIGFDTIDVKETGTIDFEEFCAWWTG